MPFEFGRPFGVPGDAAFQLAVLRSALSLLEASSGPVLRDYPTEAPRAEDDGAWACPLPPSALPEGTTDAERLQQRLLGELRRLRPWYDESVRRTGRTAFGVSGVEPGAMDAVALMLCAVAMGEVPLTPDGAAVAMPALIRFLADDLKAFYFEAAAAQPATRPPSAGELSHWLFRETVLGGVLYDARDALLSAEDAQLQLIGRFLVPAVFGRRA